MGVDLCLGSLVGSPSVKKFIITLAILAVAVLVAGFGLVYASRHEATVPI